MKMNVIVGSLAVAVSILLSSACFAAGQVVVGAERLFGVVHVRTTADRADWTTAETSTNLSLGSATMPGTFSAARLSADYVFSLGLTLGGALAYESLESNHVGTSETRKTYTQGPSAERFGFAPRMGYVAWASERIGFWPRAGLSYFETQVTPSSNEYYLALGLEFPRRGLDVAVTLEVPIIFAAAQNVWLQLAPTLDYGLRHSERPQLPLYDMDSVSEPTLSRTDIGLQFGLAVVF